MDTAMIDAATSPTQPLPTEALTLLRDLLLQELSVRTDQAEEQGRAVAELRTDPDTAVGQFEVDWELAEVMVGWSEEAIEDIEHALARLEDGTYGRCEQCSLPIPLQRLEAIPHARFCVPCQARRDAMR
jgi:RNA polymerase-binding transcription factor DksA